MNERSWRVWAAAVFVLALGFSLIVGFVVLPVLQGKSVGLNAVTAMRRAIGLSPGSPVLGRQPVSREKAQPTSLVAWTPGLLHTLSEPARVDAGGEATSSCAACHGARGIATGPDYPNLAGQSPEAIYKELRDFQSGHRTNPIMNTMAQPLSERQMIDDARQFASYPRHAAESVKTELAGADVVRLALRGDPARQLPPCNACHGNYSGGPIDVPALFGQSEKYLVAQLHAFKTGERKNDIYARMRNIAAVLTDQEIDGLARIYSAR